MFWGKRKSAKSHPAVSSWEAELNSDGPSSFWKAVWVNVYDNAPEKNVYYLILLNDKEIPCIFDFNVSEGWVDHFVTDGNPQPSDFAYGDFLARRSYGKIQPQRLVRYR